MTNMTTNDRRIILNALYTVVEKYRECAKVVTKVPGHERMAAMFKKRSDECAELIDRLED